MEIYNAPSTSASGITVGTTAISGGVSTQLLYDNAGFVGETSGMTWDSTNLALSMAQGAITTSQPQLNLTSTWNAAGITFTGIKLNITNTTSQSASKLIDLQVAAASMFSVTRVGVIGGVSMSLTGNISTSTGNLTVSSGSITATLGNITAAAGSIITGAPAGATAGMWKFGSLVTAAVVVDTTRSLYVDIGGTVYHLMVGT